MNNLNNVTNLNTINQVLPENFPEKNILNHRTDPITYQTKMYKDEEEENEELIRGSRDELRKIVKRDKIVKIIYNKFSLIQIRKIQGLTMKKQTNGLLCLMICIKEVGIYL